jgi:hypothetical protein
VQSQALAQAAPVVCFGLGQPSFNPYMLLTTQTQTQASAAVCFGLGQPSYNPHIFLTTQASAVVCFGLGQPIHLNCLLVCQSCFGFERWSIKVHSGALE